MWQRLSCCVAVCGNCCGVCVCVCGVCVASPVGALAVNEGCLCCHVLVVKSLLTCICCHVFVVMSLLLPQSSFKHKRLWLHRQLCTSASLADARLCVCVRVRVWSVFARQALGNQVSHLSVTAVFDMCLSHVCVCDVSRTGVCDMCLSHDVSVPFTDTSVLDKSL
jgi:hypothetical protein